MIVHMNTKRTVVVDTIDIETKEHEYCLRCGRKLRSPHTRKMGYGFICEKKMRTEQKHRLF